DYYVNRPTTGMPTQCAPNTGILYKATFNHGAAVGGNEFTELPVFDCVADFQVIYRRDTNNDGTIDNESDNLDGLTTAQQTREQVKEARVYILTHEGQMDRGYSFPNQTITIRDSNLGVVKDFDLLNRIGVDWRHYRWKVYSLAVKTRNLQ
ncbi:MAG: PilW family protein, partial [Nitrospirae bacterium]|nr:PilW family protein [Nitrospirota bacterium]